MSTNEGTCDRAVGRGRGTSRGLAGAGSPCPAGARGRAVLESGESRSLETEMQFPLAGHTHPDSMGTAPQTSWTKSGQGTLGCSYHKETDIYYTALTKMILEHSSHA